MIKFELLKFGSLRETAVHFIKYSFVGFLNAIFAIIVYFLLLKILRINYLISFSISWVSGVLLTYIINFIWVFRPGDKINFKNRLWKYVLIYGVSYIINLVLLKTIVDLVQTDPFFVQLFILPMVVVINFAGIKYWALKPAKEV